MNRALVVLAMHLAVACGGREPSTASPATTATRTQPQRVPGAHAEPLSPTGIAGTTYDPTERDANVASPYNGAHVIGYKDATTRLLTEETRRALNKVLLKGDAYRMYSAQFPVSVTMELPQVYRLRQAGLRISYFGHIPANFSKVTVEASASGPDVGYRQVGEIVPELIADTDQISPINPADARWLRFTFASCLTPTGEAIGSDRFCIVSGMFAKGERVEDLSARRLDLTGTWELQTGDGTEPGGVTCFSQKGAVVDGVLMHGGWLRARFAGVAEGGLVALRMQGGPGYESYFPNGRVAALVIHAGDDRIAGVVPDDPRTPLAWPHHFVLTRKTSVVRCEGFGGVWI